jgi:hypothetical protein
MPTLCAAILRRVRSKSIDRSPRASVGCRLEYKPHIFSSELSQRLREDSKAQQKAAGDTSSVWITVRTAVNASLLKMFGYRVTGAQLMCMASGPGSGGTQCHRRFQQWVWEGKLEDILRVLAEELHARGKLQLEEAFTDASFTGARKGASRWGPPSAASGRKSSLSPMIAVFLLPLVSKALRRMSANSSKASSGITSSIPSRRD